MRYHNITKDDMLNGDGLRVVLWVAGCDHGCKGCQNPVTWDPNGGLIFDETAKQEIFEQMEKSYIAGITFSGGDPLHWRNVEEVTALAKELKEKYPKKNHMAVHRIFMGRNPRFGYSALSGRSGGRRICRGREGYCLKMERKRKSEGD